MAEVLSAMGLGLSQHKTLITHIDEGLVFLGWHIQRHCKRGTNRSYVYTYPSRKAVRAETGQGKTLFRRMDTNQPLEVLLHHLNSMLRGWCAYFRPGVSSATFGYLGAYTWARGYRMVAPQTPPDHREGTPPRLLRRPMVAGHVGAGAVQPGEGAHDALPLPGTVIPARGRSRDEEPHNPEGTRGAPVARRWGTAGAGAARGNPPVETPAGRPGPTSRAASPSRRHRPRIEKPPLADVLHGLERRKLPTQARR